MLQHQTLLGTAAACLFLAISSLLKWHQLDAAYLLFGSVLYLVSTFGVTMIGNVPLEALTKVNLDSTESAKLSIRYLKNRNYVRTIAALAAAASFTTAL